VSAASITVVGAGAIGGFVGARLVAAGEEVRFVEADEAHVAAMRDGGLRITGAESLHVRARVALPAELDGRLGVVLLAVKARDTAAALETIAPRLSPDGCIVSLQNGLEEYRIAAAVGTERTVGASLSFGGHYVGPGEIAYGGPASFHVGELDGAITPRVERLAELLSSAHPAEVTGRIFGHLWGKSALGACYFATALVDADVREILSRENVLPALGTLVAEVARVAAAEGVACEPVDRFDPGAFLRGDEAGMQSSWEAQRQYWTRLHATRTGVWRDLWVHRRPTESQEILGPVLERARVRGVRVPLLERLTRLVRSAEAGHLPEGWSALDEIADVSQARL